MKESSSAEDWLGSTGAQITVTPDRVVARCLRPSQTTPNGLVRPSISFDPSDPVSVAKARELALAQVIPPRTCGDYCPLPCTLRRLEDPALDYLWKVFGINNTGSET